MGANILLLETTADICSAAISKNGEAVSYAFEEGKKHSSVITLLIDQVCKEAQLSLQNLDAVALNMGPGSYTGLRVGLSAAKGICYAHDLPLIATNGFEILYQLSKQETSSLLIPCIHARKDEFFFSVFDGDGKVLYAPHYMLAADLTKFVKDNFTEGIFCGEDRDLFTKFALPNIEYIQTEKMNATHLAKISHQQYIDKKYTDLAYSEPLYIKEFQTY